MADKEVRYLKPMMLVLSRYKNLDSAAVYRLLPGCRESSKHFIWSDNISQTAHLRIMEIFLKIITNRTKHCTALTTGL